LAVRSLGDGVLDLVSEFLDLSLFADEALLGGTLAAGLGLILLCHSGVLLPSNSGHEDLLTVGS